mmetsp:Transcript_1879/g.4183  ORF Transcript_1879/g.4183 Transcript_1879/m.4183 type:complete len:92 (-) Transcript_1879:1862-2137(-)
MTEQHVQQKQESPEGGWHQKDSSLTLTQPTSDQNATTPALSAVTRLETSLFQLTATTASLWCRSTVLVLTVASPVAGFVAALELGALRSHT